LDLLSGYPYALRVIRLLHYPTMRIPPSDGVLPGISVRAFRSIGLHHLPYMTLLIVYYLELGRTPIVPQRYYTHLFFQLVYDRYFL